MTNEPHNILLHPSSHLIPGYRSARADEVGIMGINSADKPIDHANKTLLDTPSSRLVFYGAMVYSIGSLALVSGLLAIETIQRLLHKGRGI